MPIFAMINVVTKPISVFDISSMLTMIENVQIAADF